MLCRSVMSDSLRPHGAHQALLSMEFSRQEYWSGLPFPPSRDLPDPGIKPASPALAGGFFTTIATWEAPLAMGILLKGSFIIQELWGAAEKSISLTGSQVKLMLLKHKCWAAKQQSLRLVLHLPKFHPLCVNHTWSAQQYLCYCYLNSQLVSGFQSILAALWKYLENFQKALSPNCDIRISRLLSGHSFKIEIKFTQYTVNHVKTHKPGPPSTFTV